MKKKILILSSLIMFALIVSMVTLFYGDSDKAIFESGKNNTVVRSNALTMMYETEAGSGEYAVSSNTTWPQEGYVFNERLSSCENGGILSWNSETKRVVMKTNTSDKCYVYFDVYEPTFAEYIINNVYVEDGVNGLYYHDGVGSYTNADQEAGDGSYRYAGANPNNYVCFGSDEETCPVDNLYRIIGVFEGQVKLIKDTSIGKYYWIGSSSNSSTTWSSSTLNTGTLNGTYLNGLGSTWSNLIATTNWKVGGMAWSQTNTAKQYYTTELGSSSSSTTYSAKIGLMYVCDYGYAADPSYWTTELYKYEPAKSSDWMNIGITEWTISRCSDGTNIAFLVNYAGDVGYDGVNMYYGVRPSFYLESSVEFSEGDGSEQNPFRIA